MCRLTCSTATISKQWLRPKFRCLIPWSTHAASKFGIRHQLWFACLRVASLTALDPGYCVFFCVVEVVCLVFVAMVLLPKAVGFEKSSDASAFSLVLRHSILSVKNELLQYQPASWISGMWKSAEIVGLGAFQRAIKANPVRRIIEKRAISKGFRLHISQYRDEIIIRTLVKVTTLKHTVSVRRQLRKRSTIIRGGLLTAGFWSQDPEGVLDGSNSDAWFQPKMLQAEESGNVSTSGRSKGGSLHDILFSEDAGSGVGRVDPNEAAFVFANEHFVDVGGRAGAKQEVELFSFKNGALEIVSRAPDGTQMQLFCRRVSGDGGIVFNAANPKAGHVPIQALDSAADSEDEVLFSDDEEDTGRKYEEPHDQDEGESLAAFAAATTARIASQKVSEDAQADGELEHAVTQNNNNEAQCVELPVRQQDTNIASKTPVAAATDVNVAREISTETPREAARTMEGSTRAQEDAVLERTGEKMPPPHAGTVEVQSPQACLRPNLDGVWVVDKESLRVSDGFYDAFTRNFVEKQAVKGLLLHTKMYLQITPETFRNERTTRVWFREVYKFKILKRDSVHGGVLGTQPGAFTTDWSLLTSLLEGVYAAVACSCALNKTMMRMVS
eukprot:INCI5048.17.p1 GENE.INCI5048.17~~INCI5048.17.p1  ORF type:complete len:614 (-),score=120.87 INCI5048.17:4333-6174(-)